MTVEPLQNNTIGLEYNSMGIAEVLGPVYRRRAVGLELRSVPRFITSRPMGLDCRPHGAWDFRH